MTVFSAKSRVTLETFSNPTKCDLACEFLPVGTDTTPLFWTELNKQIRQKVDILSSVSENITKLSFVVTFLYPLEAQIQALWL
jgi:hypothetical protein